MSGHLSSGEREFATLVAQLHALEEDIGAARDLAPRATSWCGLELHAHREPARALHGERVTLADGAQIVIRPIEPDDQHELAAAFEHLGALSRFQRFGERMDHLTRRQLIELTRVDHESQEALVALDALTGDGIGLARYVRASDDPARARVTCTVIDPWQGRGVGTALVERLAARARAAGIDRCTATILVGNQPARRLLEHVADETGAHRDAGMIEITAEARRTTGT
jgi:GNAT superfamily N-acetyltransferase